MRSEARTIGVEMHGVTLNLCCDHEPQLRYTETLLGPMVRPPFEHPHLEVAATWLTPASHEELAAPVFDVTGLDAYGKRMHLGEDRLVWSNTHRDKHLQLCFRRRDGVPCFDVAYSTFPRSGASRGTRNTSERSTSTSCATWCSSPSPGTCGGRAAGS